MKKMVTIYNSVHFKKSSTTIRYSFVYIYWSSATDVRMPKCMLQVKDEMEIKIGNALEE